MIIKLQNVLKITNIMPPPLQRQMFEFNPFYEYFVRREENSDTIVMTYQALGKVCKLQALVLNY